MTSASAGWTPARDIAAFWGAYVTLNLLIIFFDLVGVWFVILFGAIGWVGGRIGSVIGALIGFGFAAFTMHRTYDWFDGRVREAAVSRLRKLGINVSPKDLGFLAHKYYQLVLPTPEIEEEFRRRFKEIRIRYAAAYTTAYYVVVIATAIFTLILYFNILVIELVLGASSLPDLLLPIAPVILLFAAGIISGSMHVREEMKTVVLRRPETTSEEVEKVLKTVLNAIAQGILDAILY